MPAWLADADALASVLHRRERRPGRSPRSSPTLPPCSRGPRPTLIRSEADAERHASRPTPGPSPAHSGLPDRGSPLSPGQARQGVLWEPHPEQLPDRSRQRPGRSSRRLVERDRLLKRGYSLLLRVVFRCERGEHGLDVCLPSSQRRGDELIRWEWVAGAADDKPPARPAADRGRRERGGPERGRAWPYGRGNWSGRVFGGGRPSASFETCATRPLILSHSVATKLHGIRSHPILRAQF